MFLTPDSSLLCFLLALQEWDIRISWELSRGLGWDLNGGSLGGLWVTVASESMELGLRAEDRLFLAWYPLGFSYLLLNWSIIALQCCVSFCYTTMWISYMYTSIPSLFRLPPTHPHSTCLNHHRAHLSFLQWPNTQRTRYRNCLNVRWCQWQN